MTDRAEALRLLTGTDLLAVGHTSGSALLSGVVYTLSTRHLEGAA